MPVEFYLHAGSEADSAGLRAMAPDLPEGSLLSYGTFTYAGLKLSTTKTTENKPVFRKAFVNAGNLTLELYTTDAAPACTPA